MITQGLINSIEKKRRLYVEWNDTCTLDCPDGDLIKKALRRLGGLSMKFVANQK